MYKAFNWGTGEAVAVKQIKLVDVPRSELRMIEVSYLWYFGFDRTCEILTMCRQKSTSSKTFT